MGCTESLPFIPVNPDAIDASHFEFMKVVGRGAFGKVNAVLRKPGNGITMIQKEELLAIKRINKAAVYKKDPKLRGLSIERDILCAVRSPFNVKVLHIYQNPLEICMVMPFLKGGDLRYYLKKKGKMTEDMARFYGAEILLGLSELHSMRYIHRDLKPENFLFDEMGHIVITDYGIACKIRKNEQFFTSRSGTNGYQAPEVVAGLPYTYSADIYSFGVVLFEMVMGIKPVNGDVDDALAKANSERKRTSQVNNRSSIMQAISPELTSLLKGLLEPKMSKRIGGGNNVKEIMKHPFFAPIDWEKMKLLEIAPPYSPDPNVANCSNDVALEEAMIQDDEVVTEFSEDTQKRFDALQYNIDLKATNVQEPLHLAAENIVATPPRSPVLDGTDKSIAILDFPSPDIITLPEFPVPTNVSAASGSSSGSSNALNSSSPVSDLPVIDTSITTSSSNPIVVLKDISVDFKLTQESSNKLQNSASIVNDKISGSVIIWTCQTCTFDNNSDKSSCEMCGARHLM